MSKPGAFAKTVSEINALAGRLRITLPGKAGVNDATR